MGLPDIIFGPLLTLAAVYATWYTRRIPVLPFIPPVLFNALGVSAYLYFILGIDFGFTPVAGEGLIKGLLNWIAVHPYWAMVISIGIGQTISVTVFGNLFMKMWRRAEISNQKSVIRRGSK